MFDLVGTTTPLVRDVQCLLLPEEMKIGSFLVPTKMLVDREGILTQEISMEDLRDGKLSKLLLVRIS